MPRGASRNWLLGNLPLTRYGPPAMSKTRGDRKSRLKQAAQQMWEQVRKGFKFEIPASLSTDDDLAQTVAILQREHPEVQVSSYGARGIVIGMQSNAKDMRISQEAFAGLDAGGYFAPRAADLENLLASHERWMRSQGLDPEEQVKEAQEQEKKRTRIEVNS